MTFSPDLNKSTVSIASVEDLIRKTNDKEFQNDEAFKLLQLANRYLDTKDEKRMGKPIDPPSISKIQIDRTLPEHMKKFFNPATKIFPKKYMRKRKEIAGEDPYAPMYDFEVFDDSDISKDCYTHTLYFEGICWVVCDKKPIQPCTIMK